MLTLMTIILLVIVSVILIIIAFRFISLAIKNVRPDENLAIGFTAAAFSFIIILIIILIIINMFSISNYNKKIIIQKQNLTLKIKNWGKKC